MHVTRAPVLALALALAVPACDSPGASARGSASSTSPSLSSSASASAAGSASAPDPALLALAVRARDAATAIAKGCQLVSLYEPHRLVDGCPRWTDAEADAMRDSAAALRAYPSLPRAGAAASFIEEVRLFADWAALVRDLRARGTLRHYQELALAWNAWQPGDKVIVDVAAAPRGVNAKTGTNGGYLLWQRCGDVPCVYTTSAER